MEEHEATKPLVAVTNLREFFHDSVQTALRKQHVAVDDHTEHYVVNVLTMFARSEELYESTPEGIRLKPLARMLADACAAPSSQQRDETLRRLGDVSLFVAGFFAQSFARKLVDIDYHIAMGGRAYARSRTTCAARSAGRRSLPCSSSSRRSSSASSTCSTRSRRWRTRTPTRTSCGCTRSG